MAGHHGPLVKDEAFEQFSRMREGLNNNFKMNRRSGPFVFITVVAVPALLLWGSYKYANQLNIVATRRNESVWRK
uniref:ARAD1A00418p n=1 Tax=Blastobotrys adeninivorans TaxID=409370 RepID=A0A060T1G4_BLAAD